MKNYSIFFYLLLSLSSCINDEPINVEEEMSVEELLNTSTYSITIDSNTLELHAYLWRDFMPISPPDGKSLISINRLLNTDSTSIPDYIMLSKQFVINGDSLWATDYTYEIRETPDYLIERVSRDGPKWGPNIEVTVVARVINQNNDTEYYLRRDNQMIIRTD